MKKCDFCTQQKPDGDCYYSLQVCRENYCKEAIKKMIKALRRREND